MASSARAEKVIHQDYIARIRYSNTLPPPPNPPRLLEIPNTGLAGDQYTVPGFASRLAREQPLNIEADAELGMPLDLVGMPGIFDGDESSIQAPLHAPLPHPHDRALLRSLATLGKPKFSDSGVSFLRRTEYISAYSSKGPRFDSNSSKALATGLRAKRPRTNIDRESPEYIKGQIAKGFDTAASNLRDSSRVRHPFRRNLKLEEAYPVIPDLEAFGDVGGYIDLKFGKHPSLKDVYDTRLETGILRPIPIPASQLEERRQAMEAYLMDPANNPKPPAEDDYDYEFFLVPNAADSEAFKRKFDPTDLMHNDDSLYPKTVDLQGSFEFEHIRIYETVSQTNTTSTKYDESVVLSVDDGEQSGRQKGAYYYPIVSRVQIDPRRKKNMARKFKNAANGEEIKTDLIRVVITDPDDETAKRRAEFGEYPYGKPEAEEVDNEEDGDHEPDDEAPLRASNVDT